MRYFLKLAYNGTSFHGWQSQPNAISVQSVIETALSTLCRQEISITGAGRTDSGVHARLMYAHFDCDITVIEPSRFLLSLNRLVGKEIVVYELIPVKPDAHARFDATERVYKYFISYIKNPFLENFCYFSQSSLDIDAMNEAAGLLKKTDDFTSFAKLHSDVKTNICDVRNACWLPIEKDEAASSFLGTLNNGIVFTITADRFLRNMVRAIVGTLVDIGRHKLSTAEFVDIIKSKDRCKAGTSMPAKGLFLWDILYPYVKQNKSLSHDRNGCS